MARVQPPVARVAGLWPVALFEMLHAHAACTHGLVPLYHLGVLLLLWPSHPPPLGTVFLANRSAANVSEAVEVTSTPGSVPVHLAEGMCTTCWMAL